jgi:two-component sensor histidine kinase
MPAQGVRVLYVDDDPGIARLVEKSLQRRGYAVEHASGCDEALARIDRGGIDVVGLDHFMPGCTGLDLLDALRERADPPPVVYVTSSGDTSLAVTALKQGAVDYVPKDVAGDFLELLVSAIEGAIEQTRLKREKIAAENAVREQRDRAEMLLREVNHRVGNSLSLVAAMVRIQANALSDRAAITALQKTQTRINAIAAVHKQLYTSGDVRTVPIGEFLGSLVAELETAMRDEGHVHAVRTQIDSFAVPTDKAISIGIVVTELVTNAYKYAYPDGQEGEIRVFLRKEGDTATLVVEDDGVGSQGASKPAGTGVGGQIVEAMATTLKAAYEVDPKHRGTRVVLTFKP